MKKYVAAIAIIAMPTAAFAQEMPTGQQWAASAIAQLSAQVMQAHDLIAQLQAQHAADQKALAARKLPTPPKEPGKN